MKPNRRQRTIAVLESLVRQEADETSRRLHTELNRVEVFEATSSKRTAALESALGGARKQLAPGSELNLGVLRAATGHIAVQTRMVEHAQKDLDAAKIEADAVRSLLQQQHLRLDRYAELAEEELDRLATQRTKADEKDIDEQWIGRSKEGHRQ